MKRPKSFSPLPETFMLYWQKKKIKKNGKTITDALSVLLCLTLTSIQWNFDQMSEKTSLCLDFRQASQ